MSILNSLVTSFSVSLSGKLFNVLITTIWCNPAGQIPELSERHFALNEDDEFTMTHPASFPMLGENSDLCTELKNNGWSQAIFWPTSTTLWLRKIYKAHFQLILSDNFTTFQWMADQPYLNTDTADKALICDLLLSLGPWQLFLEHHYNQPQYTAENLSQKRDRDFDNVRKSVC